MIMIQLRTSLRIALCEFVESGPCDVRSSRGSIAQSAMATYLFGRHFVKNANCQYDP